GPIDVIANSDEDSLVLSVYTQVPSDPSTETFVGEDRVAGLDDDDEVVLRWADTGAVTPELPPASLGEHFVEVRVSLDVERAVYVGRSNVAKDRDPVAVMTAILVDPDGSPLNGGFREVYSTDPPRETEEHPVCEGLQWQVAQPEDTSVVTANYRRHFSGRWLSDSLKIYGAPNILDVLEMRTSSAAVTEFPDNCRRSSGSFAGARGVIVTQKSGPIRAIRSVIGANSGPFTQRTHWFYESHEEIQTNVRVHALSEASFTDAVDWNSNVVGMEFLTEDDQLSVDGSGTVKLLEGSWALLRGHPSGSSETVSVLSILDAVGYPWPGASEDTVRFYRDELETTACECTGTNGFPGSSGISVVASRNSGVRSDDFRWPSTDHTRPTCDECDEGPFQSFLQFRRTWFYSPGELSRDDAAQIAVARESRPTLRLSPTGMGDVSPCEGGFWPECEIALGQCGDGICSDSETNFLCAEDCLPSGSPGLGKASPPVIPPPLACGDETCSNDETELDCPLDCPAGGSDPVLLCFYSECRGFYEACLSSGCRESLPCLSECTGSRAACANQCEPEEDDAGAYEQMLRSCGIECLPS
ncbi:MAG: hypothetical protein AAFX94_10135, partial [Myxococcota bacterium]